MNEREAQRTMSFTTKLQKELTRNPKKSGALGLMCAVALYFWAPLVAGPLGLKSDTTKKPSSQHAIVNAASTPVVATSATTTASGPVPDLPINWEELAGWIARDQLMQSGRLSTDVRDPFHISEQQKTLLATLNKPVEEPETEQERERELEKKRREEPTPTSLDLVLGSTIIGPRTRVATINGRAYAEGSLVTVERDDDEIAFQVTKVETNHVVLERNHRPYTLKLDTKKKRHDMIVRRP